MPVIDLTKTPQARGQGQLNKFTCRLDGGGDNTYLYVLSVVFTLANSAEAEVVEQLIPGAKTTYQRATERDDWKAQQTIVPDMTDVRVVLSAPEDGVVIIQGGALVKSAMFRASKKAVTLTVTLATSGQAADVASRLAAALKNPVDLLVEGKQQALPLRRGPVVQLGAVAVARLADGHTVWGRVMDLNHEEGTALLDVGSGAETTVELSAVTSSYGLAPGEDTEKALKEYAKACGKKPKVAPTYRAITVALGEHYASEPPSDGLHRLTDAVVARAVEITRAGFDSKAEEKAPSNVVLLHGSSSPLPGDRGVPAEA